MRNNIVHFYCDMYVRVKNIFIKSELLCETMQVILATCLGYFTAYHRRTKQYLCRRRGLYCSILHLPYRTYFCPCEGCTDVTPNPGCSNARQQHGIRLCGGDFRAMQGYQIQCMGLKGTWKLDVDSLHELTDDGCDAVILMCTHRNGTDGGH